MKASTLTFLLCLGILVASDSMKENPALIAVWGIAGGGAFATSVLTEKVDQ